jgi:hypothetical protein
MGVLPGKRMLDAEMRRRMEQVMPHARRALMINKALETRQSETAALSEMLGRPCEARGWFFQSARQLTYAGRLQAGGTVGAFRVL